MARIKIMENKMKYIINYTKEGKILGFVKGDTDLNIEVSNAIWFEAQSFNKIIIDGDNISFDKVDWRTHEEIAKNELRLKINEAKHFLDKSDKKVLPYYEFEDDYNTLEWYIDERSKARKFIRDNKW